MSDVLVYHDGKYAWYLGKPGQQKAKRAAAKVRRIDRACRELCAEMGWEGYTLHFAGPKLDPSIYEKEL